MQSLNDDERKGVLGVVLADELKAILEYVKDVPVIMRKVFKLDEDVSELQSDMKVVKTAVTDMSRQISDHEIRITRLEVASS